MDLRSAIMAKSMINKSTTESRWRGLTIQLLTWIVLPTLLAFAACEGVALHKRDRHTFVSDPDSRVVRTAAAGLADGFTQRRLVLLSALRGAITVH